jgi:hypothetical protein
MPPPQAHALDYINFLVATPSAYSCLEAGRGQPTGADTPAHDALTRLLHRLAPAPPHLWQAARAHVPLEAGLLSIDATPLDTPYAQTMARVRRPGSGKHHRVVSGSTLVTLL